MGWGDWLQDVPLVGGLIDATTTPNPYDAQGNLEQSKKMATGVYDAAMANAQSAAAGPKYGQISAPLLQYNPDTIKAQTVNAPGAITADKIQASGLVAGPEADALRAQQLTQAQNAANSPSSAEAQMRKAGAQIERQQAGMAATARGQDRASARRDAMLATGTQGMEAAATTSALAAQENAAKQQAYTQALQGVRAGDVTAANTQAGVAQANQAAGLQAQTTTGAQALQAGQLNQAADINAQTTNAANRMNAAQFADKARMEAQAANATNAISAYGQTQQAQNAALGTANNATSTLSPAQSTAASYGSKQVDQRKDTGNRIIENLGPALMPLSDERAKQEASPIAGDASYQPNNWLNSAGRVMSNWGGSPGSGAATSGGLQSWAQEPADGGNWLSALGRGMSTFGAPITPPSDERAKQDVSEMAPTDLADWAEAVPLAAWRYKPGIAGTDDGREFHTGTMAGALQETGPLGRLMVHERPDGLKTVDKGEVGLAVGKGALARANEALDWARAAFALQAGKRGKLVTHG